MGPRTKELVEMLGHLVKLLERDGQGHWANWMQKAKLMLESSDYAGIEKVLSAYGGMGSFNDVGLSLGELENQQFSEFSTRAYNLAEEIRRSNESNT